MRIRCFGCDTEIEGDDPGSIADRFMAHAGDSHDWSYPDKAIRNYALNYAEAIQRLTGSTERLSEIGTIKGHPVTEDRIDDWLRFFDHDGFAGNPEWAACYCLEPHEPPSEEDPEHHWSENRAAMTERLRTGGAFGYLAYVDGKAAGWVNASPRSGYGLYRSVDSDGPEPASVIGVSCFVVAPPYRRHGVAGALLDRVIADASARGASWVEGYPRTNPEPSDAGHFLGPRSMFDSRGFAAVETRERDTVVRRPA